MAGKVQNIKDGDDDDVRRCLWVAEEKVDDVKEEIRKHKSVHMTEPKKLEYFWLSGKREVIRKICHDSIKEPMSATPSAGNNKTGLRCSTMDPFEILLERNLGITLKCHFPLEPDDDTSAKVQQIIQKLYDMPNREYDDPSIMYNIEIIEVTPAWSYTIQGGDGGLDDDVGQYEKRIIDVTIVDKDFRDCHLVCPEVLEADIITVLNEVWKNHIIRSKH
ncbi:PREDICTED: uncharacterized protein LOC109585867 [Amphimedon queenslandica]|uniref:Uncharacterized protein n=1 Tax=Amphimedon queenslandica TaxID=400682 RepID=A0A1X7TUX4_AMPQE|nr:PREDICTED: uncharacterized protein LOC109585867 [Amphimedon queenslandica]|eukprot:XP_019857575.1 PREDICTED: uncharacterized protein LOC109585867 [Amphimedon queenslandica]